MTSHATVPNAAPLSAETALWRAVFPPPGWRRTPPFPYPSLGAQPRPAAGSDSAQEDWPCLWSFVATTSRRCAKGLRR